MNILTRVGPGSVSNVGVFELPHLHSDAGTRTRSPSESKAVFLNKLLTSYPILVANKLASKYRSVASVHTSNWLHLLCMLSVDFNFSSLITLKCFCRFNFWEYSN